MSGDRLALITAAAVGAVTALVAVALIKRSKTLPVVQPVFECECCSNGANNNANKKSIDHFAAEPRQNYLSWEDYFMSVAFLSAQRSKDPNKQVGACIVGPDKIISGIGYNGFPRGCADNSLPWAKKSQDGDQLKTKYPYVCHAEMNAIMNKNQSSLEGATIYVTMFPCNECSKLLIQSGIKEVVYYEDKRQGKLNAKPDPTYTASMTMLGMAGVIIRQHRPAAEVRLYQNQIMRSPSA
jgi:dCMP deaminase